MSLGSLVIELQGNIARLQSDMGKMEQIVESRTRIMDAAAARTSKNLQEMATAAASIRRPTGVQQAAKDIENLGHTTTAARREMLVLAHELSQGNYKRFAGSLMVLGEQMDWMGKLMSPVGLAFAGVAGSIVLLTGAFIKGALESAHFRDSLTLTGNYAALTEGRFNALAQQSANATHSTISNAREMAQGLVTTGRFSGEALASVTKAALQLQHVSGMSAEDVIKDMQKMGDGVLKYSTEANRQYHFLDGALYDHIKALEEQGKREEAEIIASRAMYEYFGGGAVQNLGYLERAWIAVRNAVSSYKDALLSAGRTETTEDQIARIDKTLENYKRGGGGDFSYALSVGDGSAGIGAGGSYDDLVRQRGALVAKQRNQRDNADLIASKRAHDDQVVEAKQYIDRLSETYHTGAEELKQKLDEIQRQGTLAGKSPAEIAALQDKARKQFAGHGVDTHAAEYQSKVKPLEDQVKAEEKVLSQREAMLTKYYKADQLSMSDYYDGQAFSINEATKKITALYDQQIAAAEASMSKAKDARQRLTAATAAQQLRDQRDQALSGLTNKSDQLMQSRMHDMEQYAEQTARITAELDRLQGHTAVSTASNFDRTNAPYRRRAEAEGDVNALAGLGADRAAAVSQAQMNDLLQQQSQIEERLQLQTDRLNLATSTGQISQLDALRQLSAARADAAKQLDAVIEQQQVIASQSGIPALVNQADQSKLKFEQLQASTNVLGQSFRDVFQNSLANSLDRAATKTETLRQAMLNMILSIQQALLQLASQDIAKSVFQLGSGAAGGSGGGGGGFLGSVVGLVSKVFGGGGAAGSENLGAAATSTPDDLISGFRAAGGGVDAGSMYQVNERGPELLQYANKTYLMMGSQGGKVSPMSSTSGGGAVHNWNVNMTLPPQTSRATGYQQARAMMSQARIAMNRG
ncbi:phage tail length tape measure family protein [Burkholderia gladioli]|uniref:phage tail length tape measure family protein n=1 Tax=Burkholderia gladioli TaxID=28095 RepID=UPI00163FD2DA|nr:phage tail length tape measure family protein [Burkholderia gladioli]